MATFQLDIVTAEKIVFSDEVNELIAEGMEGQMTILPHHASLMTILQPGYLIVRKGGEEHHLTATGGFLEVGPDKVIVLADACDRTESDLEANAAKQRAELEWMMEETFKAAAAKDYAAAEAALLRSLTWVRGAEGKRRRRKTL